MVAASQTQAAALWKLRESISEAQKREGASIKHDISVPVAAIPDFLAKAAPAVLALVPGARPVSFGHLGDGNLHFNFNSPRTGDDPAFLAQWDEVQQTVHDLVKEFGGSISAEHGIGAMKVAHLPRYKSHEELDAMRALKRGLRSQEHSQSGQDGAAGAAALTGWVSGLCQRTLSADWAEFQIADDARRLPVGRMMHPVHDRHRLEIERAQPLKTGDVDAILVRIRAALVVGIDAAMGAEIMPRSHGVELIDGELVRALQNVQAGYIR